MKSCAGTYYVTVIEDTSSSQIIGTATLVVEHKFIHSTGQVFTLRFALGLGQNLYRFRFGPWVPISV